jgi:hypothetical protein
MGGIRRLVSGVRVRCGKLRRPQNQSGRFVKGYFFALPRIEPRFLSCPSHCLVLVPRCSSRNS